MARRNMVNGTSALKITENQQRFRTVPNGATNRSRRNYRAARCNTRDLSPEDYMRSANGYAFGSTKRESLMAWAISTAIGAAGFALTFAFILL